MTKTRSPFCRLLSHALSFGVLLAGLASTFAQPASQFLLEARPAGTNGWFRLHSTFRTNAVLDLQGSSDLSQWSTVGIFHDQVLDYPDLSSAAHGARYYRVRSASRTSLNDWRNQVQSHNDLFLSSPTFADEVRWIKFTILLNDPTRVYFQDSQKYLFHYDFAKARLPGFSTLTRAQFDAITLRRTNQVALMGTLLVPPAPQTSEYGVQFVGLDAYPVEQVAAWFQLVQATVATTSNARAFYVPTLEQSAAAEQGRSFLNSRGVELASALRWTADNAIYSAGWAFGRLKLFPASEITSAYQTGQLLPGDILLTDGVPAEIPILAGVVTLAPSTPNSHVALLAKSYGIPFAFVFSTTEQSRLRQLAGRKVIFYTKETFRGNEVQIIDVDGQLPATIEQELADLKAPPTLKINVKTTLGQYVRSVDQLTPSDVKHFGGKAANFGFLRRAIPANSPTGIAVSFDLWDDFMNQTLTNGQTLKTEISNRLAGFTFPPNMAALLPKLAEVRALIRSTAKFSEAQRTNLIQALAPFATGRKIRFRSSTNMEDTEQFIGAGLYDSYSGCLADDTDADSTGPSQCDPTEAQERGVFRAIQRVYASFYNDNAFLERLRHRVDESQVGMALLVHESFPDETEAANGVATGEFQRGSSIRTYILVSQKGAVSVSNPDGSALPEVMAVDSYSFGTYFALRSRSTLVPLGGYVLEYEKDYRSFLNLYSNVADAYLGYYPAKSKLTLDFEYKKLTNNALVVKQVREIPQLSATNTPVPCLLGGTNELEVFQGEYGDVFANHYLKSQWRLVAKTLQLSNTNLQQSFCTKASATLPVQPFNFAVDGSLATLPGARFNLTGDDATDSWTTNLQGRTTQFALTTTIRRTVSAAEAPFFTLGDFEVVLSVSNAPPSPTYEADFSTGTLVWKTVLAKEFAVLLAPATPVTSASILRTIGVTNRTKHVVTRYYWPQPPSRGIGYKTAPLARFEDTTITGLTTQPIILRGYHSQTYRPGHHNFSESFIFEPRLEPGLPAATLAELEAANVRYLLMMTDIDGGGRVMILGFDNVFREL